MKKILLIQIMFLLLFASVAMTQQEKTSIGVFSGVSLNTNTIEYETGSSYLDYSFTNDSKVAFNLGMFVMYDIVPNFGFKIQGQYTNKGGTTESRTFSTSATTSISREYTNTINYLQFSLLPQLNLPLSKTSTESKAYFNAGGYFSFKLSATETIDNQTTLEQLTRKKNISNSVSGTDSGLIFAGGIIYKALLIDIRYDLGLSDIVDDPILNDVVNIKNSSLNFSIGWIGGF